MPKKKTQEDYLLELINKSIYIIPLETYINFNTKILHKCICGNEWEVMPKLILRGVLCGCKGTAKPNTNNWYLNKLIKNKITVIPLEAYINSNTKILHKCICGNKWFITPNDIIKGVKCGCINGLSQIKSNKWYLEKLEEKDIKVIPLEPYIKSRTKILHKCYCNNEWLGRPMDVLKGMGCGCKRNYSLRGVEFYRGKKTILYYIKIKGLNNEDLYKIGVTLYKESIEKSLKKRFYRQEYEIIQTDIFKDGSEAFTLEQQILEFNREYRYLGEKVLKSGNTELFIKDITYEKSTQKN